MLAPVNSDSIEFQPIMAEAATKPNEIAFLVSAARRGSWIEDLPKLNEVNKLFENQSTLITLTPKAGRDSEKYPIPGFKSVEWQIAKNGNRKLIVSTLDKQIPIEIGNSQTTIKFEELKKEDKLQIRNKLSQEDIDLPTESETLRTFHAGLVKPANSTAELTINWKYARTSNALMTANQQANQKFTGLRVAVYLNDLLVPGIKSLGNNPFTHKSDTAIEIQDALGEKHKVALNAHSVLRIVENPLSKEEAALAREVDVNNQEWEWSGEFLRDKENLQRVNERLLPEFIKPKPRIEPKLDKKPELIQRHDFDGLTQNHKLVGANKVLFQQKFFQHELEIYSGKELVFKGFIRERDALVYDPSTHRLNIYNQKDKPTVLKANLSKPLTFIKTKNLIPQEITIKANFIKDFENKVNDILKNLSPCCRLRIPELKDSNNQPLVLKSTEQIAMQGLNSPPKIWILNRRTSPFEFTELRLDHNYQAVIEEQVT